MPNDKKTTKEADKKTAKPSKSEDKKAPAPETKPGEEVQAAKKAAAAKAKSPETKPAKAAKEAAPAKKASAKPAQDKPVKAAAKPPKAAPKPKKAAPKGKGKTGGGSKRPPLAAKTFQAKPLEIESRWRLIDASGVTLGRLSSRVATILMGKDKPSYTRHTDTGDFVVIINAEKVRLTGKKVEQKRYHRHTGYSGGIKTTSPKELLAKNRAERMIEWAVYGMLPKTHLGRRWYGKLKVYTGPEHPHKTQPMQPEKI